MIRLSKLITALTIIGYDKSSELLLSLASISYPDNKKIMDQLWNTFDLDKPKAVRIFRFLGLKNLSLTDSTDEANKNEASAATKQVTEFMSNNQDIKDELSEAQRLWETWGTWDPLKKTVPQSETTNTPPRSAPPEDTFYEDDPFKGPDHPDINGAIPGKKFSNPYSSLVESGDFYYISPLDGSGNMMSVDDFFEKYIKMGVVPITSGSGGSIFYEMFLNTAEDIYDMDQGWVSEYIGMLKMEDSVYGQATGGQSRIFNNGQEEEEEYDPWEEEDRWEEEKERQRIKGVTSIADTIKSDKLKLSQQALKISQDKAANPETQGEISGLEESIADGTKNIFDEIAGAFGLKEEKNPFYDSETVGWGSLSWEDQRKSGEWQKAQKTYLEPSDIYKIIAADLKTYNTLFRANKELGLECAEYIAENNPPLFARLRLHKLYEPESYEFSEKSLERLVSPPLGSTGAWNSLASEGLDVFYGGEIWKDLPEHFLELAAKQDALKFFASSAFKTGATNHRSIEIASAEYLNREESALAWFKLGIAGKLPKRHIDVAMRILAEQSPAHFLSLSTKSGKKFCDLYPRFKEQALDGMKQESYELANNDPITFYGNVIPEHDKTWADYFPKRQTILAKKSFASKLSDSESSEFAVKFILAGLCQRKDLAVEAKIAVNVILNDFGETYDYGIENDDLINGENLETIRSVVNDVIESPEDYDYFDRPKETLALFKKIKKYLSVI